MATEIVIGIHTRAFASALTAALNASSVHSSTSDYGGDPKSGLVQISVDRDCLDLAVRTAEGLQASAAFREQQRLAGLNNILLIPVDLSDMSMQACRIGFELAQRLGLSPLVMHVFSVPTLIDSAPDTLFPSLGDNMGQLEDEEVTHEMQQSAAISFGDFKKSLDQKIKTGEIPNLAYQVSLTEGIPEQVILEYTRLTPPSLVVMGTRGTANKSRHMIGSVTAEVLDNCRVPVFTVPENWAFHSLAEIKKLAYFCNLDGQDLLSVEFLMRMFGYPEVDILLVPASDRNHSASSARLKELSGYLTRTYSNATFTLADFPMRDLRTEFEALIDRLDLQMLVVPNKRQNIFSRLFNPGIPHRVLFERDIPMLALPV